MQLKQCILLFIGVFSVVNLATAQKNAAKADGYFFSYDYSKAITAYEQHLAEGINLTSKQRLNLADSYYNTDAYEKAGDLYVDLFTNDSIMDNLQFNRMLQSLTYSSKENALDSLILKKMGSLSTELIENAEFNAKMFKNGDQNELKFNVFNLEANTPQSDFSAAFYNDQLLFTSGRPSEKREDYAPAGEAYLNIYNGEVDEFGQVKSASTFKGIKSSDYHKATPYFAEELGSFFFILSNTDEDGNLAYNDEGKNSLAIGQQKKGEGGFWYLLKDLSTSFYYPFYDKESEKLYFAANFDNGYGGTDIYFVYTNKGQVMSAPINLGPRINSPGNEIAPYIFENSLYFSSDIFYGIGGMDIYKSNIRDDKYSIPVNLGPQVNSEADDFGFIIKNYKEGLLGYFASNRAGGKGKDDIYGFLVDEKPGFQTFSVKGKVVNLGGLGGVEDADVAIYNSKGELLQSVKTDANGNYSVEVPWQEGVRLFASKNRYSTFSIAYEGEEMKVAQNNNLNMGLAYYDDLVEKKEGQTVIKLKKFYFPNGQSKITSEIATELDKVVDAVRRFPNIELRIETHTDSRGGGSTNFRLTQQRSDNIKKYLLQNGVRESNVLYSIGYGETKLLNACKNGVYCIDLLHKENQRSLIVVLNDNILFE